MIRSATCSCGNLAVEVNGEPKFTAACSCTNCQKRTGSVLGVVAYFADKQLQTVTGERTEFAQLSEAGRKVTRQFCPECGTTVLITGEFMPGMTAIAVGCFADPSFPEPMAATWNATKHPWVDFPGHWRQSDTQDF